MKAYIRVCVCMRDNHIAVAIKPLAAFLHTDILRRATQRGHLLLLAHNAREAKVADFDAWVCVAVLQQNVLGLSV